MAMRVRSQKNADAEPTIDNGGVFSRKGSKMFSRKVRWAIEVLESKEHTKSRLNSSHVLGNLLTLRDTSC